MRSFLSLSLCLGVGLDLLSCDVQEPCGNAVQDGDETDVDCGGSCGARCQPGLGCGRNADCDSHVCANNQCAAPACDDKQRNGEETDVDCGGNSGCAPCDEFQKCGSDIDCESSSCLRGICAPSLVREISPALGARSGGTVVNLRGSGLTSKAVRDVLFGGQAGTALSQKGDGSVQVTTPSRPTAGLVDVSVVFGDGSKATIQASFRYYYSTLQFTSAFKFTPGASPKCEDVATADLNGDGKSDLILLCWASSPMLVQTWLSNGNGTFTLAATQPIIGPTGRAVAADLNGDGKQDLAVTFWRENKLGVFLGKGDGSFVSPPTYLDSAAFPIPLAAADFDHDGYTDLLVVNQTSPQRCLFRNNQGKGFDNRRCDLLPGTPGGDVAIGDFDQNGGMDAAIAPRAGASTIILSLNNYNGYFTRDIGVDSSDVYDSVSAFDVNQDGITDLVSATWLSPYYLHVRLGIGNGTFGQQRTAHSYSNHQAYDKAIADYNADGRLDLAGVGYGSSYTSVLLNLTGDGTFALGADLQTDRCYGISSGDFDGDGRIDIVLSCPISSSVNVFLNSSQ
jgi:hypothetical protein